MFTDANIQVNTSDLSSSSTPIHSNAFDLDKAILKAQEKLLSLQQTEGYWVL